MKICLINNLYPPLTVGGAEEIVKLIAENLCRNHEVIVLTGTYDGHKELIARGRLKIFRLNTGNLYHYLQAQAMPFWKKIIWHFFDLFGRQTCRKVKEVLKSERPDIVITHNLKGFSYQVPKLITRLKLKHIHTLHDYQLIDPHGSLYRPGGNIENLSRPLKIYKNICKRLFSKIDVVISPSKFVLDKHLAYGFFKKSRQVVMPNPAILENIENNQTVSEKVRLLYLGQLAEHKGIRFLLESFKSLPIGEYELLIAGEGKMLADLKNIYRLPNVNFLGRVPHGEISNLFRQSDITVVPSLWWDNSPTVIYESYSYGRPVLVSDSGGSKELVLAGKTGYIFKSGDQTSLLSTLVKIAQNKPNLDKLGVAGREFISQYRLDNYLAKLIQLCEDLNK